MTTNNKNPSCEQPPRSLVIDGEDSIFIHGENCIFSQLHIHIKGRNNKVIIGNNCELRGTIYIRGNDSSVVIGSGTTSAGLRITGGGGKKITIGEDCMFSRNIEVRCWDEHPVYDRNTRELINGGRDVIIEDHVWVGEGVLINKGVHISKGCVIGARSVVIKPCSKPHSAYAGYPAKIIKENIVWGRSPKNTPWDFN